MPSVVVGEEITSPDNGEDKPEHEDHERACQQQQDGLGETFSRSILLVEASVDLFLKIVKLVTVERDAHGDFCRLNDQLVKTLTAFPVHTFDCDAHFTAP